MKWDLEWEAVAEEALKRFPSWQAAARVSRAITETSPRAIISPVRK